MNGVLDQVTHSPGLWIAVFFYGNDCSHSPSTITHSSRDCSPQSPIHPRDCSPSPCSVPGPGQGLQSQSRRCMQDAHSPSPGPVPRLYTESQAYPYVWDFMSKKIDLPIKGLTTKCNMTDQSRRTPATMWLSSAPPSKIHSREVGDRLVAWPYERAAMLRTRAYLCILLPICKISLPSLPPPKLNPTQWVGETHPTCT